jgi:hypothetical protein
MDMIADRNRTSHTYNEVTADAIATNIKTRFFDLFVTLREKMQELSDDTN